MYNLINSNSNFFIQSFADHLVHYLVLIVNFFIKTKFSD